MPAYVIADNDIHDPDAYAAYAQQVPATLPPYDGRLLVAGGDFTVEEGGWDVHRLVVIEFPDMERLNAWADSPEYTQMIAQRQEAATTRAVFVEGLPA